MCARTITVPLSELRQTDAVQSLIADPQFQSLSSAGKRKALAKIDPTFAKLSDASLGQFLSEYDATRISNQGFIPDPTQNYSPPAGLRLTRNQLLRAMRTKEPAYNSGNDKTLIDDFLNMYPDWRNALVEGEFLGDSQPKWYADAVEAGVSVTELPDEAKPGSPPEPLGLSQSVSKNLLLIVSGLFFLFTGAGLLLGVRSARHES